MNPRRTGRRFLDCPACLAPNSFHAKRPTIDQDLVQALELTKGGMRQELVQVHQQPWKLPLGVYPNLLERVANWKVESSNHNFAVATVQEILQGLLQVHNF
jgi:hypothetical protein